METMTDILLWIGKNFSRDLYFTITKIQGIFWSLADIAIIWYMLRIADFIRNQFGRQKITLRYYLLLLSTLLTPFLLVMKTAKQFFILETAIFAVQYLLLMYSVVAERKDTLRFIRTILHSR